jgi:hypothetical protein
MTMVLAHPGGSPKQKGALRSRFVTHHIQPARRLSHHDVKVWRGPSSYWGISGRISLCDGAVRERPLDGGVRESGDVQRLGGSEYSLLPIDFWVERLKPGVSQSTVGCVSVLRPQARAGDVLGDVESLYPISSLPSTSQTCKSMYFPILTAQFCAVDVSDSA